MIEVNGSERSGSGTLLRHAVSLATLLGEELHMWNIRAKREKPGLRHQHRQTILACCDISGGTVEGAEVGSTQIRYKPGRDIKGGNYDWDIGTGGSTTMLAMTILPLACFARQVTMFNISGGLFQDFAPSAYHMQHVLFPTLRRMGMHADLAIKRPGYAELGDGTIELKVKPLKAKFCPLRSTAQNKINQIGGIALSSHLEQSKVSERMVKECKQRLEAHGYQAKIEMVYDTTASHEGAALAIWAQTETCVIGSDRAGKKGRRAEAIGEYVARNLINCIATGATVDKYLADQLIIYAALAEGTSEYLIPEMTEHINANLWLAERILGTKAEIEGNRLRIEGIEYSRDR
jgi:RNA 3'-terminal phosphate cyclase (ATP)